MLTIQGRLDKRPPLKLGKIVLTLTESTEKYPLTAENLRPRGRLRGGVNLVIDAPGASIMQHNVWYCRSPFFSDYLILAFWGTLAKIRYAIIWFALKFGTVTHYIIACTKLSRSKLSRVPNYRVWGGGRDKMVQMDTQ